MPERAPIDDRLDALRESVELLLIESREHTKQLIIDSENIQKLAERVDFSAARIDFLFELADRNAATMDRLSQFSERDATNIQRLSDLIQVDATHIRALARIAEIHEKRLTDIEDPVN